MRRSWIVPALLCVFAFGFLAVREYGLRPGPAVRVDVFPTTRGSSALITAPDGQRVLVGAGGDASILEHLGRAMPFLARTIDLLIVTGDTQSKTNAAAAVLERYTVGMLMIARSGALVSIADRRGTAVQPAVDGLNIELAGARLTLGLDREGFPSATRIDGATQSALLLADFPSDDERRLLAGGGDLHTDVLVYKDGRKTTEDLLAQAGAAQNVRMGSGAHFVLP